MRCVDNNKANQFLEIFSGYKISPDEALSMLASSLGSNEISGNIELMKNTVFPKNENPWSTIDSDFYQMKVDIQ